MRTRLVEKMWDCEYCNAKGIGGSLRKCPRCGKARDENTIFYGRHKYVSQEEAVTINRNPDWVCDHCGTLNSDDYDKCCTCGSPREDTEDLDYFQNRKKQEEKKRSQEQLQEDDSVKNEVKYINDYWEKNNTIAGKRTLPFDIKYIWIALCALFAVIGIIYLAVPKNKELTVSDMS